MIVWKFAVYLGVMTLLFALIVSVVAIARYGRRTTLRGDASGAVNCVSDYRDNSGSGHGEKRISIST